MITNTELDPTRFRSAATVGLRVFPVKPKDKKPAIPWAQFQDRAPSQKELTFWDEGNFNVGVVCGAPSDVIVLDVDSAEAQELVDALNLPSTPTVRTAQGAHYYFRRPSFEVRNGVRIGGVKLDIRGDGGFAVGSGSIHPSGARYEWIVSPAEMPFAPFPDCLRQLIGENKKRGKRRGSVVRSQSEHGSESRFRPWLMNRLDEAKSELDKKVEGERNDGLFLVAVRLAADVAATGEDWSPYADELAEVALKIGLEDDGITATLDSAWRNGCETPTPWIRLAQDWIYISGADQFLHLESGERLSQQAFRTTFNELNPGDQGNIVKLLTDFGYIEKVQNVSFDPGQPLGLFEKDGRCWLNTYRPSAVSAEEGDAAPFQDFMEYLVPNKGERDHLLKMFAHLVRNPGEKLSHALILGSQQHGVGKSTLLEILFELLGRHNCRKATTEEIESPYQSYIEGKLLVLVEEINFGVGRKAYNKMKDMITSADTPVRRLYQDVREVPNMANFVFLTNLEVPILMDSEDRRFFVVDSPAFPREPDYYSKFNQWWRANLGVIRHYLDQVALDCFNRFARPPITAAKTALIENSRTPLVQELLEMIEERQSPFRVDIVTLVQVIEAINRRLPKTSRNAIQSALRKVGAVDLGQHRIGSDLRQARFLGGGGDRPCLWVIRHAGFWEAASAKERVEEYLAEEGRLIGLPQLPVFFAYGHAGVLPELSGTRDGDPDARIAELLRSMSERNKAPAD